MFTKITRHTAFMETAENFEDRKQLLDKLAQTMLYAWILEFHKDPHDRSEWTRLRKLLSEPSSYVISAWAVHLFSSQMLIIL